MRYVFVILVCTLFWQQNSFAGISVEQKILNREMRRKLSFEQHHRDKAKRERNRRSKAHKQKIVRLERELAQEKGHLGFRRKKRAFPVAAWRRFIERRNRDLAKHKIKMKEYIRVKKKLDRLKRTSKYKIDKNKEYQL